MNTSTAFSRHILAEVIKRNGTSVRLQRVEFFGRTRRVWIRGDSVDCDDVKEIILDGQRSAVVSVVRKDEGLFELCLQRDFV